MKKVLIIGCGAIFNRHLESIKNSKEFKLVAICDIDKNLAADIGKNLNVKHYSDYKEPIALKEVNFVVVASPNSFHYEQAIYALKNGCDVLIEKPVCFESKDVLEISDIAKKNNQNAYCVLQVRLNNSVSIVKKALSRNLLGEIRGVSFVQRWQRPYEYFSGWRNSRKIGGGTLYEVGIHYLDILQMKIQYIHFLTMATLVGLLR